ncbi:hypothetical protein DFH07DRAFT_772881 [Mycena maculata]|uniref:Uncharacterized protein n=1 Tax=Mycena maculata TaxID=230809 RepID=A0AAD7NEE4_9AGAR|nr:hypothetical protein DFH07DRAFT_772881 [Mycena maculata]
MTHHHPGGEFLLWDYVIGCVAQRRGWARFNPSPVLTMPHHAGATKQPNTAFVRRGLLQTAKIGGGLEIALQRLNVASTRQGPLVIVVDHKCSIPGVQSYSPAILENGQIREVVTQCGLPIYVVPAQFLAVTLSSTHEMIIKKRHMYNSITQVYGLTVILDFDLKQAPSAKGRLAGPELCELAPNLGTGTVGTDEGTVVAAVIVGIVVGSVVEGKGRMQWFRTWRTSSKCGVKFQGGVEKAFKVSVVVHVDLAC